MMSSGEKWTARDAPESREDSMARAALALLTLALLTGGIPYTAPDGDITGDGQVDAIDLQCGVLIFELLELAGEPPQSQCLTDGDCEAALGPGFTCRMTFAQVHVCMPGCLAAEVSFGPAPLLSCDDPDAETPACKGLVQKRQLDLNCDEDFNSADVNFLVSVITGKTGGPGTSDIDGDGRLNSCDDDSDADLVIDDEDCEPFDPTIGANCAPVCPPGGYCPATDDTLCGTLDVPYLHIPAGVTVTCAPGCTQPVIVNVAGDAIIEGTIDLTGEDGHFSWSLNATNGNPYGASGGIGGQGRCGGQSGGAGGHSPSSSGQNGSGGGGGKTGSSVYKSTTWGNFWNGGNAGGGGYGSPGGAGFYKSGSTGNAGQGGAASGAATLSNLVGGSGGGGGSGGLGGASTGYGGAGGGAGGGVLKIVATGSIAVAAGGVLRVDGGAGGSCQDIGAVGGGGAGAGGAVWLSAPTVTNDGLVSALGGVNCFLNGGAADDGEGGAGRVRVDNTGGTSPEGAFSPAPGHVGIYSP
jgi:hypothetical protein